MYYLLLTYYMAFDNTVRNYKMIIWGGFIYSYNMESYFFDNHLDLR